jgi:hypothetical protein
MIECTFRRVLFSEEFTNKEEDYKDAPWTITFDAEATATHRFEKRGGVIPPIKNYGEHN